MIETNLARVIAQQELEEEAFREEIEKYKAIIIAERIRFRKWRNFYRLLKAAFKELV